MLIFLLWNFEEMGKNVNMLLMKTLINIDLLFLSEVVVFE